MSRRWILWLVPVVVLVFIVAFAAWSDPADGKSPTGTWSGPITFTGGFQPGQLGGNTPAPVHGVMYVKVFSIGAKKWEGDGEMYLAGEPTRREVTLGRIQLVSNISDPAGPNLLLHLLTKQPIASELSGYFEPDEIRFSEAASYFPQFTCVLHRSTRADYEAAVQALRSHS